MTYYKVLRQRIACSIYQGKKQSEKDGERKHELKKNKKGRKRKVDSLLNLPTERVKSSPDSRLKDQN